MFPKVKCLVPCQARRNEKNSVGGGYQLCNIFDQHGWLAKKFFHLKLSKTAKKTQYL